MAKELRTLLIDCRIALRSAAKPDAALGERLQEAIREIDREALKPKAETAAKAGSQQVALAWQTVARSLKHSHPALYDELNRKVMHLLDVRELVEPTEELLQLDNRVKDLEAERESSKTRMDDLRRRAGEAQQALDGLYRALTEAVPQINAAGDAQSQALARIEHLLETREQAIATPAGGSRGKTASDNPVPTRSVLQAVIDGQRALTREQREWAIGEALGVTGWQYTPVELVAKGEVWLAHCLLDAKAVPE